MGLKSAITIGLGHILPKRVKNALFHLSFNIARDEFEKFAYRYAFAPNMKFGLEDMARRGFAPKAIIDVGAFKGDWSRMAKSIWPNAHLYMFEPNAAALLELQKTAKDLGGNLFTELLGEEDGKNVQFNIMGSGSSIFEERSAVPRKTESRQLRTLDSMLDTSCESALLKIDAQGYELEILKGANRLLKNTEAVLLEIAVIEINKGAPLLHEVIAFLKARGFVAYELLEIHRRPLDKALNQLDMIFIREESNFIADKRHFAAAGPPPPV